MQWLSIMINSLFIENYRGIRHIEVLFAGNGSNIWIADAGAGKSTVVEMLYNLQVIARGATVTQQVLVPTVQLSMSSSLAMNPMRCMLKMQINGAALTYDLSVSVNSIVNRVEISRESLQRDGVCVFERQNGVVSLSSPTGDAGVVYPIEANVFALTLPLFSQVGGPVSLFRSALSEAFIVRANYENVSDVVMPMRGYLDFNIGNFSTWIVNFLAAFPFAYEIVSGVMLRLMPDYQALNVHDAGGGMRRLALKCARYHDPIPVSMLSRVEKMMLFVSAMCAVASVAPFEILVWDDFLLGIDCQLHEKMIKELSNAFRRGQFFVLSSWSGDSGLSLSPVNITRG